MFGLKYVLASLHSQSRPLCKRGGLHLAQMTATWWPGMTSRISGSSCEQRAKA
jgi:hypothetical protein